MTSESNRRLPKPKNGAGRNLPAAVGVGVGLGCDISQADRLVYADALTLTASAATPIGPGCSACPRENCASAPLEAAALLLFLRFLWW